MLSLLLNQTFQNKNKAEKTKDFFEEASLLL